MLTGNDVIQTVDVDVDVECPWSSDVSPLGNSRRVSSAAQPPFFDISIQHNNTNLKSCTFLSYDPRVMASLAPPSPSRSPARMPRKWARKCERYCCLGATYFPLFFVYGITTWAVWVEATIGFLPANAMRGMFPRSSGGVANDLQAKRFPS